MKKFILFILFFILSCGGNHHGNIKCYSNSSKIYDGKFVGIVRITDYKLFAFRSINGEIVRITGDCVVEYK